jgi:hypothetical protein
MKLELEFQSSILSDIKINGKNLEFHFSPAIVIACIPAQDLHQEKKIQVDVVVCIGQPKYKSLPKVGKLTDGELYGILGKSLNGRVPIDLNIQRPCELVLSNEDKEYTISGQSFHIIADLKILKNEMH